LLSWTRIRIKEQIFFPKLANKPHFPLVKIQNSFCMFYEYVLLHITFIKYGILFIKIQLLATAKCDQDLDPDPHWFGSLDPDLDPH
jgi:hypothetical protein